jgi:hypothetical protein
MIYKPNRCPELPTPQLSVNHLIITKSVKKMSPFYNDVEIFDFLRLSTLSNLVNANLMI